MAQATYDDVNLILRLYDMRREETLRKARAWFSRSEEHTSELQSPCNLVCRLLLEKKKKSNAHILSPIVPARCHECDAFEIELSPKQHESGSHTYACPLPIHERQSV